MSIFNMSTESKLNNLINHEEKNHVGTISLYELLVLLKSRYIIINDVLLPIEEVLKKYFKINNIL